MKPQECQFEAEGKKNVFFTNAADIRSKTYKQSLSIINQCFNELQSFTEHLQIKVDNLLQTQEKQFVKSYKLHMYKIKQEFNELQISRRELQNKIKYYENEGEMSKLVLKVKGLQLQSKTIYATLTAKEKKIKDLQISVKVFKQEAKRLQQKIKMMIKEQNQKTFQKEIDSERNNPQNSNSKMEALAQFQQKNNSFLKKQNSLHINHTFVQEHLKKDEAKKIIKHKDYSFRSLKQDELMINEANHNMQRQIKGLKQKNKRLVSIQSTVISRQMQMEQFFVKCVQEIKKQIKIRKKMNYCSLNDFLRQDKISLLIKLLSSEQILGYLHQRIFRNYENKLPKITN